MGLLNSLPSVADVAQENDGAVIAFPAPGAKTLLTEVSELLRTESIEADSVQVERGRLDEVFRTVTGGA